MAGVSDAAMIATLAHCAFITATRPPKRLILAQTQIGRGNLILPKQRNAIFSVRIVTSRFTACPVRLPARIAGFQSAEVGAAPTRDANTPPPADRGAGLRTRRRRFDSFRGCQFLPCVLRHRRGFYPCRAEFDSPAGFQIHALTSGTGLWPPKPECGVRLTVGAPIWAATQTAKRRSSNLRGLGFDSLAAYQLPRWCIGRTCAF